MNKDPRETLSTLMDGECTPPQIRDALPDLLEHAELRARWESYHLIGQAIRGEPLRGGARATADGLQARLAEAGASPPPANVRALPGRGARARLSRVPHARLLPPVATALAASLALLAVFVLPLDPADEDRQLAERAGPMAIPAPALVPPTPGATRWQNTDPVLRAKLDHMLVSHHERVPAPRMPGYVSYASVVGHEARR
ncbi:MAG: sigma-E factor negative regulatory protein [Thiohalocapsa sp.]|nr:sigma-E factor negative regulatory protein [Thiohalocapsa sp.]